MTAHRIFILYILMYVDSVQKNTIEKEDAHPRVGQFTEERKDYDIYVWTLIIVGTVFKNTSVVVKLAD